MSQVLNFSERASLAIHGLAYLGKSTSRTVSVKELAEQLSASKPHLAKVFQRLANTGIVESRRGPSGGFALRKSPDQISFLDIYEAVEGKVKLAKCPLGKEKCVFKECIFGPALSSYQREIYKLLKNKKISDLTGKRLREGR